MLGVFDAALQSEAEAAEVALQRIDEAAAVPRPSSIGSTYLELEREELELEQPEQFTALGIETARPLRAEAAGLALAAEAGRRLLDGHLPILTAAEERLVATTVVLSPHRRRAPKAKRWHYLAKTAFLCGDLAGVASAAIWLGEYPEIAVVMAIAAAAATVTAGLSGAEVRDLRARERRARPLDTLTEQERPFAPLFTAPDTGWPFVKALLWVSGAVASMIAVSVFALRASIEDPLAGAVFGGIAMAVAAASWIESYMYADEAADLIETAEADYARALARHQQLAGASAWRHRETVLAEAESVTAEHDHRGEAARRHLRALRFGVLRRNPQVVGHGPAAEHTAIGQTTRRGGGAQ
ncbi:hypothetical protein [Microbacterium sp.]|uniref:hypothetical protein n=1 Tax=Microbacterium sp. TaxID=51671 RepID=UPI0039E28F9C